MSQIEIQIDPKNSKTPDKILCRISQIDQTVYLMWAILESNVQLHHVRTAQHCDLRTLATPVHIEALTE